MNWRTTVLSRDQVEMAIRELPIMGATLIRLYKMIYFSIEKQAQEKIMNCTVSNRAYLNFVTIDSRIFLYKKKKVIII